MCKIAVLVFLFFGETAIPEQKDSKRKGSFSLKRKTAREGQLGDRPAKVAPSPLRRGSVADPSWLRRGFPAGGSMSTSPHRLARFGGHRKSRNSNGVQENYKKCKEYAINV